MEARLIHPFIASVKNVSATMVTVAGPVIVPSRLESNADASPVVGRADGAVEALQQVSGTRRDPVLTHWKMLNIDGITLIRRIRETDKGPPLVMCTTEAERSRVLEAIKAGVNNYVATPFTAEALSEKINTTMAKAGAVTS